jgi:hypothetical protein
VGPKDEYTVYGAYWHGSRARPAGWGRDENPFNAEPNRTAWADGYEGRPEPPGPHSPAEEDAAKRRTVVRVYSKGSGRYEGTAQQVRVVTVEQSRLQRCDDCGRNWLPRPGAAQGTHARHHGTCAGCGARTLVNCKRLCGTCRGVEL